MRSSLSPSYCVVGLLGVHPKGTQIPETHIVIGCRGAFVTWGYPSHLEGSTGLCSISSRPLGGALSYKATESWELVSFDAPFSNRTRPNDILQRSNTRRTVPGNKDIATEWVPCRWMTIHRYPGTHSLARRYDASTYCKLTDLHHAICASLRPVEGEAAGLFDNCSGCGPLACRGFRCL